MSSYPLHRLQCVRLAGYGWMENVLPPVSVLVQALASWGGTCDIHLSTGPIMTFPLTKALPVVVECVAMNAHTLVAAVRLLLNTVNLRFPVCNVRFFPCAAPRV